MCGLTVDLRLRAWCRSACSCRCRRSLAIARSLFPAYSLSGLPAVVSPFPSHRMSNELVKTARVNRSSVKPLQFIPIHSRSRIGCRMMCPAGCLSSSASCAALALLACRLLICFVHPSRPSPRRACRAALRPISSHLLALPALAPPACRFLIRFAFLPAHRVAGRGVPHLASISSCV